MASSARQDSSTAGPIAITGAAGLVGRAVARAVRDRGLVPRPLFRPSGTAVPVDCGIGYPADVGDVAALTAAFAGCRTVVHAAGRMSGSDEEIVAVNVDGTRNVLAAIAAAGVPRLVFVSTVAVYGGGDLLELAESAPLRPQGTYAASKVHAESLVRAACASAGLEAWSLRSSAVYGGDDRTGFSAVLVGLARDGVIPLVRGGEVRLELTAVTDLAHACVLAATGPGAAGDALNVTSGGGLTLTEIVRRLREGLGLPARTAIVDDPGTLPSGISIDLVHAVAEHRSFALDEAERRLGYRPAVAFPGDLRRLLT